MNFLRRFKRHIIEGFVGIYRHFGTCLSAAMAVNITLVLISLFLMITINLERMTKNIEGSIRIAATVKYENEKDIDKIHQELKKIEHITNIEHRTKKQEFDFYVQEFFSDHPELFKAYENENPFHEIFMIIIDDGRVLEEVAKKIQAIEGIEEVNYGGISSLKLVNILNSIRFTGLILVIGLCVLAIYLVFNTIKLAITARADEIHIMRNVGALNSYVIMPFLIEGILIGIIGAIIPISLTIFGYLRLYEYSGGYIVSEIFMLIQPLPFVLYLSLILVGLGMLVGFIGSYIGVRKYLKLKR